MKPATNALGPIFVDTTQGLRITAAAGTYITPPLFAKRFKLGKSPQCGHSNYPYHTLVHCKGFLTAAPLRARDLISVPFSGLPLSRPVPIAGLVGIYPANYLIGRRPIEARLYAVCAYILSRKDPFQILCATAHYPQFPRINASLR